MFEWVETAAAALREGVAGFEPGCLTGEQAARLVEAFTEIGRLAEAGRSLAARRVEETKLWKRHGHRSAADWLAAKTGESVGAAGGALECARRLEALAATSEAFRAGRLSPTQAKEIASAAAADPRSEADLLDAAATEGVPGLRERCRRVRSGAQDEAAQQEAIRRRRFLRHWGDEEGAFNLRLRTTAADGAVIVAALERYRQQVFAEARAAGRRESPEAYGADALVAMARSATEEEPSGSSGPRATVHVRVDHEALVRGYTEGAETCEVPGVGPVAVATARSLLGDAVVELLITRGSDVVSVVHLGRTVTAAQRRALEERDPECVVPGCHVRHHLEIDHLDGWALTHTTRLDRLARQCRWHHYLKTHQGYRLLGGPGHWQWLPPDLDPDPPPGERTGLF